MHDAFCISHRAYTVRVVFTFTIYTNEGEQEGLLEFHVIKKAE